jgi:hypothetical protein
VSPLESDHYPLVQYAMAVRNVAHYAPAAVPKPPGALHDWEILVRLAEEIGRVHGGLWRLTGKLHAFLARCLPPHRVLDLLLRRGPRHLKLRDLEEAPHGLDLGPLEPRLSAILATKNRRIDLAPPPLAGDIARLEEWLEAPPVRSRREFLLVGMRSLTGMNTWLHNLPGLAAGQARCVLFMHPGDASRLDLRGGELIKVSSPTGEITVPLETSDSVMPGVVCLPFGWGHSRPGVRLSVATAQAGASYNDLLSDLCYDAVSGTSVLNGIPVRIEAARAVN